MFLDFKLDPGSQITQDVPDGWTAFVYIMEGTAHFGTPAAVIPLEYGK